MRKILNKKGFTLVELMVVVAIMGVLVAIAVPVYGNVTTQAQENVCEANRRTYDSAIMMWIISNPTATEVSADITAYSSFIKDGVMECPTGGTYSVTPGDSLNEWTVNCSNHAAAGTGTGGTP